MKTLTMADWYAESTFIWERLWENAWPFIHDEARAQVDGTYHHNGILYSGDPAFDGVPREAWTRVDFNKLVNRFWRLERQRAPMGKNPSTTWVGDQSKLGLELAFIIQLTKDMPSQAYGTDPGSVDVGDFGYLEWPFKDHKRAMGDLDWWLASDQMQNVQWLDGSTLNLIRNTDEWVSMGVVSIIRQDGQRIILPDATRFLYMLAQVEAYFYPIFNSKGFVIGKDIRPRGTQIGLQLSGPKLRWLGGDPATQASILEDPAQPFVPSANPCWVAVMASMGMMGIEADNVLMERDCVTNIRDEGGIEVITREGTKIVIQPLSSLQAILQIGYDRMLSEFGANIPVEEALTRCLINRRA
jgi:virulence-associated protein VagC